MFMRRAAIVVALWAPLAAAVSSGVHQGSASTGTPSTIHVPGDQPTIQAAIDAATPGDVVVVDPGRYDEHIDFEGKPIEIRSAQGPAHTIIDGSGQAPVVTFQSGETTAAVLDGFTLQYGAATSSEAGGGVRIVNASPSIIGNVIKDNAAFYGGGGVGVDGGSPLIEDNTVTGNSQKGGFGGQGGGGISVAGPGSAQVMHNVISGNSWNGDGGGIEIGTNDPAPLVEDNVVTGNAALSGARGGGIDVMGTSQALIVQNLVTGNRAAEGAGVDIWSWVGSVPSHEPTLLNNTVAGNSAGALVLGGEYMGAGIDIAGNIFSASAGPAMLCDNAYQSITPAAYQGPPPTMTQNDVFAAGAQPWQACPADLLDERNISADPLFVDAAGADYHLTAASPAISAGDSAVPGLPTTDIDGHPRIVGTGVDQGVYEFSGTPQPTSSAPVPLSGVGDASADARFVTHLYNDLLGRPADAGAAAWANALDRGGITRTGVALALAASTEYLSDQVEASYLAHLGRDADPAGLGYWLGYLGKGGIFEDLETSFLGAPEYYAKSGGTPDAFLTALYTDVLGRAMDPAGRSYWTGRLTSGTPSWVVAASVVMSSEAVANRVVKDYLLLLRRDPDAGGVAYWSGLLQHGTRDETLVGFLAGSDEYWADSQAG